MYPKRTIQCSATGRFLIAALRQRWSCKARAKAGVLFNGDWRIINLCGCQSAILCRLAAEKTFSD